MRRHFQQHPSSLLLKSFSSFTSSILLPSLQNSQQSCSHQQTVMSKNKEKKEKKKLLKLQKQQEKETTSNINNEEEFSSLSNVENNKKIPFVYPSFVTNTNAKSFLDEKFELDPESGRKNKIIFSSKNTEENENFDTKKPAKLGGRVTAVRDMGKIVFITLKNDNQIIQVTYSVDEERGITKNDLKEVVKNTKMGDIVGVEGVPGVTKRGEPSVFASKIQTLSKYAAVQEANCPSLTGYLKPSDPDILYRYRFVDLMANSTSQEVFRTRAKVLQSMRRFLDDRGFIEVETPVFHTVPSGAAARPFRTFHESNDSDLFLRVAPELYLKQCVVGGLERVYEIGRVFRNEDTDRSHNPEFTSCEFYQAFATYRELMPMTEEMIRKMCQDALGTTKINITTRKSTSNSSSSSPSSSDETDNDETREIDFAKPFKVIDIIPELESQIGIKSLFEQNVTELDNEEGAQKLKRLFHKHSVPLPPEPASPAKLFDKLIDHFITDHVVEPAFVIGHPTFMSPLAKEDPNQPGVSERFELFVNGMEICNSYSELNDPVEQKHRFEQQLKQRVFFKDEEAQCVDETFLKALQVGLPPTAGWGMGIDRLVMLFCQCSSIRDVILFPLLRSAADSRDSKRKREAASYFGFDPFMTKFCLNSLEAEFLKRGTSHQEGVNLVRHVHRALDTICGANNGGNNNILIGAAGTKNKSLCDMIFCNSNNDQKNVSSTTAHISRREDEGKGKDIVQQNEGDRTVVKAPTEKPDPEFGVMALILLGGLRDSPYVLKNKSERFLLDVAFNALCDPSVASSWWWRK